MELPKDFCYRIAFIGKARSGKDTSFSIISDLINNAINLKFADPIYDILHYAQKMCDFPIEKDRQFLQYIGTEWARNKNENIWVDLMEKNINNNKDKSIIITDCRFKNEVNFLIKNNFVIIKLIRMEAKIESGETHQSENDLNDFYNYDYDIYNNSSLDYLTENLIRILKNIFIYKK